MPCFALSRAFPDSKHYDSKELGGTEGMQVHRSHWIARVAVKKIVRRAGRTVAFLGNGAEVPVSRRYAGALRDANWV